MNSLNVPVVVIRPTRLTRLSATQTAPSGPGDMPSRALPLPTENSVVTPEGVTRPILSGFFRTYQTLPSGPGAMSLRRPGSVRGYAVNVPDVVIFPSPSSLRDSPPLVRNQRLPSAPVVTSVTAVSGTVIGKYWIATEPEPVRYL